MPATTNTTPTLVLHSPRFRGNTWGVNSGYRYTLMSGQAIEGQDSEWIVETRDGDYVLTVAYRPGSHFSADVDCECAEAKHHEAYWATQTCRTGGRRAECVHTEQISRYLADRRYRTR